MQAFLPSPAWQPWRVIRPARWTCQSPQSVDKTRTQLLNLLASVPLTTPTQRQVTSVEACLLDLLQHRSIPPGADDFTKEPGAWRERLNGRWNLAFSTEAPLRQIIDTFGDGLSENGVYQLLADGKLQNVIATSSLALVVDGEYDPLTEYDMRKCPFEFRGTRVLTGGALKRFEGDDGGWGIDWRLGFAVGKGCFNVVWLDHALRIDRDTYAKDRDWINVYVYAGPVEKCRAR